MSTETSQQAQKSHLISNSQRSPLKAVLPVSSLMKKELKLNESSGDPSNICRENTFIPISSLSAHMTPFSSKGNNFKNMEPRPAGHTSCIRRTSSLDTICLKGQWPRDAFYKHSSIFKVNKAIQTDNSSSDRSTNYADCVSEEDKLEKLIRERLQKVNMDSQSSPAFGGKLNNTSTQSDFCSRETHSPPIMYYNKIRSVPGSPIKGFSVSSLKFSLTKPSMGSSSEGLNQELEKLDLQELDDRYCDWSVPDGRRAPLPDLLRQTRSVNTQTPGGSDDGEDFCENNSFCRVSFSPIFCSRNKILVPSSQIND